MADCPIDLDFRHHDYLSPFHSPYHAAFDQVDFDENDSDYEMGSGYPFHVSHAVYSKRAQANPLEHWFNTSNTSDPRIPGLTSQSFDDPRYQRHAFISGHNATVLPSDIRTQHQGRTTSTSFSSPLNANQHGRHLAGFQLPSHPYSDSRSGSTRSSSQGFPHHVSRLSSPSTSTVLSSTSSSQIATYGSTVDLQGYSYVPGSPYGPSGPSGGLGGISVPQSDYDSPGTDYGNPAHLLAGAGMADDVQQPPSTLSMHEIQPHQHHPSTDTEIKTPDATNITSSQPQYAPHHTNSSSYAPYAPNTWYPPQETMHEGHGNAEVRESEAEAPDELEAATFSDEGSDYQPNARPKCGVKLKKGRTASGNGNSGGRSPSSAKKPSSPTKIRQAPHGRRVSDNGAVSRPYGRRTSQTETPRPFICPLAPYRCSGTFSSKNEWKRHIHSQHICVGFWRCDQCPDSANRPNDFNRKDLFTQHLRRMHSGPSEDKNKASRASGNRRASGTLASQQKPPGGGSTTNEDFEKTLDMVRDRCWIQVRTAPQSLQCAFCGPQHEMFSGSNCVERWMEHVGKHMASSAGRARRSSTSGRPNLGRIDTGFGAGAEVDPHRLMTAFSEDDVLRKWLLQERLIEKDPRTNKLVLVDRSVASDAAHQRNLQRRSAETGGNPGTHDANIGFPDDGEDEDMD